MRVFLSFNSRDQQLADHLRAALLKAEPQADIFFSPVSLGQGFWLPKLAEGIKDADAFLLLIGPRGVGPWQEIEYHEAFDRHLRQPTFALVPLILGGSHAPGLPFLRRLNWLELSDVNDGKASHNIWAALKGGAGQAAMASWKLVHPYRGLEAMTEANADYFYGREAETERVLRLLAEAPARLPMLIGASGVGKSSIAQAGVLSALKAMRWPGHDAVTAPGTWPDALANSRNGWAWLPIRPGDDPLTALSGAFIRLWLNRPTDPERGPLTRKWAEGLRKTNTLVDLIDATQETLEARDGNKPERILIYLDQGEELYTRSAATPSDASRFSKVLAEALSDPRLVAFGSLRADYFDRLQSDEALFSVHEHVNVRPLTREQLHEVVTGPSQSLGVTFEDERMPDRIVSAAAEEPGALPLLSYLMTDMWAEMVKRGDGVLHLPMQAIDIGGVLAARAEQFLRANPGDEPALKRLLTLKLAIVPSDGEPVRRQARRSECSSVEWSLAERLADHPWRLVVIGERGSDGEVLAEVAHEALLHAWPRLEAWLRDEREFLVFKGDAERAERRWREMKQADRALLTGLDLARAEEWLPQRPNDIAADARNYIQASIALDRATKARALRFQRRVSLGAGAAAVLMAVIGALALWQWQTADRHRQIAENYSRRAADEVAVARFFFNQINDSQKSPKTRAERDRELFYQVNGVANSNVAAQRYLGLLYSYGQGTAADHDKAFEWLNRAASAGDANAMLDIGVLYQKGDSVAQDYAQALAWYRKAIEHGHTKAYANLARMYERGMAVERDYAKALELYQKAASAGSDYAMASIGVFYANAWGVQRDFAKARHWLEQAAAAGDIYAMGNIGLLYANGWGVEKDYAKAREWNEKAAAAGDPGAMANLGTLYEFGQGVTKDYQKAREYYERAVEAGDAVAMRSLGSLYSSGRGVRPDSMKAFQHYINAVEAGDTPAMLNVGWMHENGRGVPQDYVKAKEWYEKASAAGVQNAKTYLGYLYREGKGVKQNYDTAREMFEQDVAASDSTIAMRSLGALHQLGLGVAKDYAKALEWYEKAAARGDSIAMTSVGALHDNGLGVPPDAAKAVEWYTKAFAAGDENAAGNIGVMYEYGRKDLPKDYAAAREWYEKGADAGDDWAMKNLGLIYAHGRGVEKNYATAREWFERAAELGQRQAMRELGVLYANGYGVPKDAAQAREWLEKSAANDPAQIMRIAEDFDYGMDVPQSNVLAREWYEKAAASGNTRAMGAVGRFYAKGLDVPKNQATALQWFEKAAAAGDMAGMLDAAELHEAGQDLPVAYDKARGWYEKAADRGSPFAMRKLGSMHMTGAGGVKDLPLAIGWYEKAAAKGDAAAMRRLGELSSRGDGLAKDDTKAREWFTKAAEKGDRVAQRRLGNFYYSGQGGMVDYGEANRWLTSALRVHDYRSAFALARLLSFVEAQSAIHAAFDAGRYAEALRLSLGMCERVKAEELVEAGKHWKRTANQWGNVSWMALFAKEYAQVLTATQQATNLVPDLLWTETNRAHALMYLGRLDDARALYLLHKNKNVPENRKLWQEVIAEDFDLLRKAGMGHPLMDEVLAAFAKN